jgi:hypothetical protein
MEGLELIPISSLAPQLQKLDAKGIRATVTLLWPYSSSTRSTALLLAESDFRLRRNKGQVRVELRGKSAEEVARTKIGIGDEVILSLKGASWLDNTAQDTPVSTPGRSVDWDLKFRRVLRIQVRLTSPGRMPVD